MASGDAEAGGLPRAVVGVYFAHSHFLVLCAPEPDCYAHYPSMSSGTTGGIIGAAIGSRLEARYGKRSTNLWLGLICFAISVAAFIGHSRMEHTTVATYQRVEISYDRVDLNETRRSLSILLKGEGVRYDVPYALWKERYETEVVLDHLRRSGLATLWVWRGSSDYKNVRGLQTERIHLPPEIGVDIDNSNRSSTLWLGFLFLGSSLVAVGCGLFSKGRA